MDIPLFLAVLMLLQFVCVFAGKVASRELVDEQDYFLAGKGVQFFPLVMSFIATQIGGGLILGSAEEAYRFGWSVLLYPLGAALGFVVLALGVGKRLASFSVSTVAQLFEKVYDSKKLKTVASLLSIISLFLILVAQVIGSRKFMANLTVDSLPLFLVFWAIVILYTVMGGLKALIAIDIIQALFFICVFCAGGVFVWWMGGGVEGVHSALTLESFDWSGSKLLGWLLMPLLFMVIEQDMAQRCFAAKTPGVVAKAAGCAGVATLLICLVPVYFGVYAREVGLVPFNGESVFMSVAKAATSPAMSAFLGCAVLMAIISTAISLINAVSSNLLQDFSWGMVETKEGSASRMGLMRSVTAGIGLLAVWISFSYQNIVDLLIESYELSVYCLVVPVTAALFQRRGRVLSAALAMGGGGVAFLWTRYLSTPIPKELFGLLISCVGFGLGECMALFYPARRFAEGR